ncbi:MAG TPA: Rieske (2Fe-2S) protein [Candidatus Polarisedimenticolia bacterium]|nr:Rieske (2Fe-2S) protein [Candidatus Polarisedimenticolia bacterium]
MKRFRRPGPEPLWREEISFRAAEERYANRRQFGKFLVLTSLGMFTGNLWIAVRSLFERRQTDPGPQRIASLDEVPVGGVKIFHYPGPKDPCLLIRLDSDTFVAYSQKCTHLACPVYYAQERGRLECPCHEGYFSVATGEVLQGPPPRPLPRIRLALRDGAVVAVGVDPGGRA